MAATIIRIIAENENPIDNVTACFNIKKTGEVKMSILYTVQ